MTPDRIYNVHIRRTSALQATVRLSALFGTLTLWVGLSHAWFGGAWVIDLMALIFVLLVPFALKKRAADSVTMTPDEIRAWVAAGLPDTWGRP